MSAQNDMILVGLETALAVSGVDAVYHRWDADAGEWQDLPISAIKGLPNPEDEEQTKDPAEAVINTVTWRLQLDQLDDLVTTTEVPDWIEDAAGEQYVVMRHEGDADWRYITPDKAWVRIQTFPDAEEILTPDASGRNEVRADWDGTYTYTGTAPVGTPESSTGWKITRLLVLENGNVTAAVATDVAWADRLTEAYT